MVGAGSGDHWPRQRPPPLCLPGRLAFFIGAFIFLGEWYIAILMGTLGFMFLPVAVGIALLKYGLYDIEVLLNRTLVYGVLTAILAAVYLGGIVVLHRLFVALTGEESTLAVVASTLLIAALFNLLPRRRQSFIYRRFYRKTYDARKTLEAFSATLRNETDLDALRDDLVGVVRKTMQPAHVPRWLRPDLPPTGSEGRE